MTPADEGATGLPNAVAWVAIVAIRLARLYSRRFRGLFLVTRAEESVVAHLPVGIQQEARRESQQDQAHEQPIHGSRRRIECDHPAGENPYDTRQRYKTEYYG